MATEFPTINATPKAERLSDEEIAALESIFGDIYRIRDDRDRFELVICAALPMQWKQFNVGINETEANKRVAAQNMLVKACCVGLAWRGERAVASGDGSDGQKAPRLLLDRMLETRGFAGALQGPKIREAIEFLNGVAQANAEK